MLPRRYWAEMTTLDFRDAGIGNWIAVLPVAAIEQHGPHLPVYALDRADARRPAGDLPPGAGGRQVE
jgi:creatinine amidohydrolase/Fe(II)-dependent formamide hydrolase-like protein